MLAAGRCPGTRAAQGKPVDTGVAVGFVLGVVAGLGAGAVLLALGYAALVAQGPAGR